MSKAKIYSWYGVTCNSTEHCLALQQAMPKDTSVTLTAKVWPSKVVFTFPKPINRQAAKVWGQRFSEINRTYNGGVFGVSEGR